MDGCSVMFLSSIASGGIIVMGRMRMMMIMSMLVLKFVIGARGPFIYQISHRCK